MENTENVNPPIAQKLYIPALGDEIVLAEDWSFDLYAERRNKVFGRQFECLEKRGRIWHWVDNPNLFGEGVTKYRITLPAGTVLRISRIYIKQGQNEFASITFSARKTKQSPYKGRFWAKLQDVNQIMFINKS